MNKHSGNGRRKHLKRALGPKNRVQKMAGKSRLSHMKKAVAPPRNKMKTPSLPKRNKKNGGMTGKLVGIGAGTVVLGVGAVGLGVSKVLTKGGKMLAKRNAKQAAETVTP